MKKLLLLSIFAACMPVISAFIMTFFEQEFIEAIVSGLLIGCIVGSIVGIITLVLNKNRNKLITVFFCYSNFSFSTLFNVSNSIFFT